MSTGAGTRSSFTTIVSRGSNGLRSIGSICSRLPPGGAREATHLLKPRHSRASQSEASTRSARTWSRLTNLDLDRQTVVDHVSTAIRIPLQRLGSAARVGRAHHKTAKPRLVGHLPIVMPEPPAVA